MKSHPSPGWGLARCSSLIGALHAAPLPPPKPLYPSPYPEKPPFFHLLPATLCLCPLHLASQGQRLEALGPVSTHPFHIPNCHGRKREQLKRVSQHGGQGAQVPPHCCLSLGHPYLISLLGSLRKERVGLPYWGGPSSGKVESLCAPGALGGSSLAGVQTPVVLG